MLPFEVLPAEARDLLSSAEAEDRPVLLDCREPDEVAIAVVAGALKMPMGDIPGRAHQELDPDGHILVMCHHGVRSLSATVWLRRQGFERAQSIAGGIDRWSREIDTSIPRY